MFVEVNKEQMSSTRQDKIWATKFDRQAVVFDGQVGLARKAVINPVDEKKWLKKARGSCLTHYSVEHMAEIDAFGVVVVYFKGGCLMKKVVVYRERQCLKMASWEEAEKARASGVMPSFYECF